MVSEYNFPALGINPKILSTRVLVLSENSIIINKATNEIIILITEDSEISLKVVIEEIKGSHDIKLFKIYKTKTKIKSLINSEI